MRRKEYEQNVFINCPFDSEYAPIFEAIVFAVNDAGFRPKCARERLDSSQIRLQKIVALISASRFSIHDLSRTDLDDMNVLPRFNMPFELGLTIAREKLVDPKHAWYVFGLISRRFLRGRLRSLFHRRLNQLESGALPLAVAYFLEYGRR